ncbi:MAG: hypothetical protein H6905_10440 [Hyphomicrobiales bacterium]|nr:hypothetical protein [Hyphomicrobiales bacterium]
MRVFHAFMSAGCFCALSVPGAYAADSSTPSPAAAAHAVPEISNSMMMPAAPPLGVIGARAVKPGQVMLNYRYLRVQKNKMLKGDDDISTTKVATTRNHFAGEPGQPATYRAAPEHMTMEVHMFGAQVGITDDFSAMLGVPYIIKERTAVTFQGPAGTNKLGTFENDVSGIGDISLRGLYKLYDDRTHHVHLSGGMSFPTGSIREDGKVLQPTGATVRRRLAYGLQLGTGTYNLLPGMTYWGASGGWNWGVQAAGQINLGENDEGYTFGDNAYATAWGGYTLGYGVTVSARLSQEYMGDIEGNDSRIRGASPTTDPNNYGGWKTLASFGIDYRFADGPLAGVTPGIEITVPLYQDLNGPQPADAWRLFAGVRKVFTF